MSENIGSCVGALIKKGEVDVPLLINGSIYAIIKMHHTFSLIFLYVMFSLWRQSEMVCRLFFASLCTSYRFSRISSQTISCDADRFLPIVSQKYPVLFFLLLLFFVSLWLLCTIFDILLLSLFLCEHGCAAFLHIL